MFAGIFSCTPSFSPEINKVYLILSYLTSGSVMAGTIDMSHRALVETLMKVLQGVRQAPIPTVSLPRFLGRPESPGDPTIDEWFIRL